MENKEQINVFDIFKDMNAMDTEKGTNSLVVSPYNLGITKTKEGGKIEMGIAAEIVSDVLFKDSRIFLLLCIDKTEYYKRKNNNHAIEK